jgi:ribosomal protein L12E/L44/L45/RPP1/RPP2
MKTLTDILKELKIEVDEVTTPEMAELLNEIIKKIDELIKNQK